MTNKQKAKRLEEMAGVQKSRAESYLRESKSHEKAGFKDTAGLHADIANLAESDAALLRESAAMWGERDAVRWEDSDGSPTKSLALYQGRLLIAWGQEGRTCTWSASKPFDDSRIDEFDTEDTLDAAKAAAIQWVDQQEGCDA